MYEAQWNRGGKMCVDTVAVDDKPALVQGVTSKLENTWIVTVDVTIRLGPARNIWKIEHGEESAIKW